jgi:hypothetical protein
VIQRRDWTTTKLSPQPTRRSSSSKSHSLFA